jgi:hypothetical protein
MDVVQQGISFVQGAFHWFATLAPGGFGLLLLPLGALGIVSLLAARNR